jgi:hypothetical protein
MINVIIVWYSLAMKNKGKIIISNTTASEMHHSK